MTVSIDGVAYEVDFRPNSATLVYPLGSSSMSSVADEVMVGDVKKTNKKSRFGLSLPSKLKKKLKSRTNKKLKGKAKMASLVSAIDPSSSLIQKWKAGSNNSKYQELESSGSLFTGRLEDDVVNINDLPTIQESPCEIQQEKKSFRHLKITQNEVVEEKKKSKKKWKRLKRFLKKFKNSKSSQSSIADTASTASAPRTKLDSSDANRDDTEVALASEDDTFFSALPSPETNASLPSAGTAEFKNESLPPSLTLVRPPSVARQASAAKNFVLNNSKKMKSKKLPQVIEYPSDEEDSSVDNNSIHSIVSPVPSCRPTINGSPRKKILNYKKAKKTTTTHKKKMEKAPVVVARKQTTVAASSSSSSRSWNVRAVLLLFLVAAALGCALSTPVWQAWFAMPQELEGVATKSAVASLATSSGSANIAYYFFGDEEEYYNKMEEEGSDEEWPWDENEAPVSSFMFGGDENGVLDCSYPTVCI